MRRLLRWTFNSLAAMSLLLCVATAGLWVRSYWVGDRLDAARTYVREEPYALRHCWVTSYRGRLAGTFGWSDRPEPRPRPPWEFRSYHPTSRVFDTPTGFRFATHRPLHQGYVYTTNIWAVPDWFLFSAFAVLPTIIVLRHRGALRRRRSPLGCCPTCGYDLRATPERCPECGRKA